MSDAAAGSAADNVARCERHQPSAHLLRVVLKSAEQGEEQGEDRNEENSGVQQDVTYEGGTIQDASQRHERAHAAEETSSEYPRMEGAWTQLRVRTIRQ